MIKGVADYAGERPDEAEVRSLANIASVVIPEGARVMITRTIPLLASIS
jgi:hypothetical protein